MRYVDQYDLERLGKDPELSSFKLRKPDIIDSAEKLSTVPNGSQDFVIAFMVMEHVEDPIGMLASAKRVCRSGGSIVLSVPDKRVDADRDRELTTFEHLLRDYEQGPQVSHLEHFYDFGRKVKKLEGEALTDFVHRESADGNIHYHVWEPASYLSFLQQANTYLGGGLEIVEFSAIDHEILASLRVTKPALVGDAVSGSNVRVLSTLAHD